MKNGLLPLMALLFVCAASASGQTTRQQALIVLNNGDTLHGWADYKGWEHTPRSISFSLDSLCNNKTTYGVADLRYFEIASAEAYERGSVRKAVPRSEAATGANFHSDSLVTEIVFLRLLVKGQRLSLYQWNEEKEHFFIRESGGDLEELIFQANAEGNDQAPIPLYKGTLKTYAVKYDLTALFTAIDDAGYDEHALAKIVVALNGASHSMTFTSPVIRNRPHWFVGGGAGISQMTISGDKSYLGQIGFTNTAAAPYLLAGFDYLFSKGVGPWGMRLELAYFSASYKARGFSTGGSQDQVTYTLQQSNLTPSGYLLYHFLNHPKLKIYGAAGIGANIASYPKNSRYETYPTPTTIDKYVDMNSFWFSANAKLGLILSRKIEAGITGVFGNYSKGITYTFEPQTYLFWIGYRFN